VTLLEVLSKMASAIPFENAGEIDNKSFTDWLVSSFTDILGDAFWVLFLVLAIGLVWMKTRNLGPTAAVAIVGSAIFSRILYSPLLQALLMWFTVLAIAIMLFRLVVSRVGR